jgi:DNA (cytosine-5)-methyltransferase 1
MAALESAPRSMRELALFAGAGGGILGGRLLGWRTVCAVERDAWAASVLVARQNDGCLAPFPIWDDVRTFDGRPWQRRVDVISGGFPCQDISVAGAGAGIDGERSGLWAHMARIVGEVRPRYVFVENSPALTSRGLGRVLGDLAALGFDAEWGVLGACDAGAPHRRERIWIVATNSNRVGVRDQRGHWPSATTRSRNDGAQGADSNADSLRQLQPQGRIQGERGWPGDMGGQVPDAERARLEGATGQGLPGSRGQVEQSAGACGEAREAGPARSGGTRHGDGAVLGRSDWWHAEPDVGRVAHGLATRLERVARVERLKCIGNGQVPAVAALAWRELTARAGWL